MTPDPERGPDSRSDPDDSGGSGDHAAGDHAAGDHAAGDHAVGGAERRRRRAEVFGDVLPEQTRDDQSSNRVDRSPDGAADEWLRSQVPPHHG